MQEFANRRAFRRRPLRTSAISSSRTGLKPHLAVVVDGENRRVAHYFNGRAASEVQTEKAYEMRIGSAELGNWNDTEGINPPDTFRNLNGCMDEFLLFSRPLNSSQIDELYLQGRP